MRICILEPGYQESDSPMRDLDPAAEPERYLFEHEFDRAVLHKRTAIRTIIELSQCGYDLFINLCDGAWDEDRPGIEVVQALERLNLPFTGASSAFYDPSRETMKKAAHYYDVPMPAGITVRNLDEVPKILSALRFPLIVKHPNSYSSIGLTKKSRVTTADALGERIAQMISQFGSALVEEFIEGREFSVLVAENPDNRAEPFSYRPVEFIFPEGESFKHFDMKWRDYIGMVCLPCNGDELSDRLQDLSRRIFTSLGGTGYGRTDIRMNAAGEMFVLEINPNCGVFYPPSAEGSADLVLASDPRGYKHFIDAIVRSAFNRVTPPAPWVLRFDQVRGYGMFAARHITAGEIIEPYEDQPHMLVTRSHVERHWDAERRGVFARYAYPVGDDVYVTWSDDPDSWKPINHSCDPNAWLDGLNVVARHAIAAGDEITIDYATFCNEVMADFECSCDSPECRGIIQGTDYLKPFMDKYGNHVSSYVRSKRQHNGAVYESIRRSNE